MTWTQQSQSTESMTVKPELSAAIEPPPGRESSQCCSISTHTDSSAAAVGPPPDAPIGPSLPSTEEAGTLPEPQDAPSPYTNTRNLLHDLTLPSIPNFDIPPSPPGSPPPATQAKFEQFLKLKKQGTHFNSKLEDSAAMHNPALTSKLMAFVGMPDGDPAQYETSLSKDLWDPKVFPDEAFRGRLRRARDKLAKEKETERAAGGRTSVDFVPATQK